ncbi:MAG: TPM domain-containing protein [Gammaproteobacteria bacterium]|nr:TPM domain-containing protein [Gammaproteobacteria bacterium]
MAFRRALRHLFTTDLAVRRAFPPKVLDAIERTITACEARHGGEIRFVIDSALPFALVYSGMTPRERAIERFAQFRVWDTAANNGVLIYLLWADHDIEIVADRGLNDRVSSQQWADLCTGIEPLLASGAIEQACVTAIEAVADLLAPHFPASDRNELPNRPALL